MRWWARIADRFLNAMWPATIETNITALADLESDRDVWEPGELGGLVAKPNPAFDDLPTIQITPITFNDDDIVAWGDIVYLRGLLSEIADRAVCDGYRPKPIPEAWIAENAWAATQLKTLFKDN